MKTHYLKTWFNFFEAVQKQVKPFEVRKNDRDFQVGDILVLEEWNPALQDYTGKSVTRVVTYVLPGGRFGIDPEYVVMGIKNP